MLSLLHMLTATPIYSPREESDSTDRRWTELERWTLEACLLRAEGREAEAAQVLSERMPAVIREWTLHCGLAGDVVRERLRRLFADTQNFVARGLAQRRLATARLMAQPRGFTDRAGPGPVGLRRHVPLADVTGMLDALAEAEREARREALWPLRSRATAVAANF